MLQYKKDVRTNNSIIVHINTFEWGHKLPEESDEGVPGTVFFRDEMFERIRHSLSS